MARSREELTNPADQIRSAVLQAPASITEALGLALHERTLAPSASNEIPLATPAPDRAAPASRGIPGAPTGWQFGEYDEFHLEIDR